jgi:hypothetical protein
VDARAVYFAAWQFELALNGRFWCQFKNTGATASARIACKGLSSVRADVSDGMTAKPAVRRCARKANGRAAGG